jgi:glutathione S-transferase
MCVSVYMRILVFSYPVVVHLLQEYMALPYEEALYKQAGPAAPVPFDKSCWTDVKFTLGLPFPNLPYLIDGDVKLCQSMAILRYVANKKPELNLLGSDELSRGECAMIESEFVDAKAKMCSLMYREGQAGDSIPYFNTELPRQLTLFETFLADKVWFAGKQLTVADFLMREYLDCAVLFSGQSALLSAGYPQLAAFKTRFETLPALAAYLRSAEFSAVSAINNQHAKFR